MPITFRETPPLELVKRFLEEYGIHDIDNATWFTKDQCVLSKMHDILAELYPYYIPCKGVFIIEETVSYSLCLKAMRHILRPYGYTLSYIEKSRNGKQTWYVITTNKETQPNINTTITFD
jgi:hypothetical protein